jgi:uncharacterized protein YcbK (DUF882 family)
MEEYFVMELLTPNFTVKEMECKCGCGFCDFDLEFLDRLQALRDILKHPLVITSGFRCVRHNEAVGGGKTSNHMAGIAVDISTWGMKSDDLYKLMNGAIDLGFTGIGVAKNFIHIDTRKGKAKMWLYK